LYGKNKIPIKDPKLKNRAIKILASFNPFFIKMKAKIGVVQSVTIWMIGRNSLASLSLYPNILTLISLSEKVY